MRNSLLATTAQPTPVSSSANVSSPGIGHNQPPPNDDVLLTAQQAAGFVNLSIAAFWRNVCNRRLPPPVYPAPRAPRWWKGKLRTAVNATAALPVDAKAARRRERIAQTRGAAADHHDGKEAKPRTIAVA